MPTKITFANQLRGIAALLVVWLHLGMHYWSGGTFISDFLGASKAQAPVVSKPWWAQISESIATLGTSVPIIDYGALGVALFFLISGFVIPFSLQRLSRKEFALHRFLRIFPTYWAALAVAVIFWQLPTILFGNSGNSELHLGHIVIQAFLIFDLLGQPPLDLVTWSIVIELKFYLVGILLYKSIIDGDIKTIAIFFLGAFCLVLLINHRFFWNKLTQYIGWTPMSIANQLFGQLAFIFYIFIGTVFHFHWKKQLGTAPLIVWAFVFWIACALGLLAVGAPAPTVWLVCRNQLLAFSIFSVSYSMRDRFQPNRILDFLANISYPWYCTHLIVGWATLWLLGTHYGFETRAIYLLIAFLTTVVIAWILHRYVEKPCLHFSKRFLKNKSA